MKTIAAIAFAIGGVSVFLGLSALVARGDPIVVVFFGALAAVSFIIRFVINRRLASTDIS